jgi:TPR repeat protein
LGNAGAMYNLGLSYENGVGVSETSAAIAASWYERAAAQGDSAAMRRVALGKSELAVSSEAAANDSSN